MGQGQSTSGGRPIREFAKVDDSEINFDISKKIKTADEFEESTGQGKYFENIIIFTFIQKRFLLTFYCYYLLFIIQ